MAKQVIKVRRDLLEACMKCPLCNKLMKEATTVSLCLHTFCRKCIYEKLSDDGVEICPVCDIELGCLPLEKLRPDHNLQDIRFKIFPYKRIKVENPGVVIRSNSPPPAKRKERSLSSLVVDAPKISPRISSLPCLSGRRSKTNARTASSIGGCNFTAKGSGDNDPEMKKITLFSKSFQDSSHVEHNIELKSNEDPDNEMVTLEGKADLWTPFNSLLEAINRTKLLKSIKQDPSVFPDSRPGRSETKAKEEITGGSETFTAKKKKKRNYLSKEVQDEINYTSLYNAAVKKRKLRATARNMGNVFSRKSSSVWFSLVPSKDKRGVDSLPKVSARYLRMKDGKVPVSSIQKYLIKKLHLTSESEVEIMCRGEPVLPTLSLNNLVDLWLRKASKAGSSPNDFVMVLSYCRKTPPP